MSTEQHRVLINSDAFGNCGLADTVRFINEKIKPRNGEFNTTVDVRMNLKLLVEDDRVYVIGLTPVGRTMVVPKQERQKYIPRQQDRPRQQNQNSGRGGKPQRRNPRPDYTNQNADQQNTEPEQMSPSGAQSQQPHHEHEEPIEHQEIQ